MYLHCRVLEPEALSTLVRLQELRLDDNLIRSIAPAAPASGGGGAYLPQLRILQLSNNRLADAADCAQKLASLPSLAEVAVAGNPFARRQACCSQCPCSLGSMLRKAVDGISHARWHSLEQTCRAARVNFCKMEGKAQFVIVAYHGRVAVCVACNPRPTGTPSSGTAVSCR